MKGPVITIDGPAGAGKTTLARKLARELDLTLLESGSLYRVVGLAALRKGVAADDEAAAAELLNGLDLEIRGGPDGLTLILDGRDVTARLRDEEVGNIASAISRLAPVRDRLTEIQRRMGERGGIVVEGRDAGTVVFPGADFKFFLDASPGERARRRVAQLARQGVEVDPNQVLREMTVRDNADSSRKLAPLKPAEGAIVIDTTSLNEIQVVEAMKSVVTSA